MSDPMQVVSSFISALSAKTSFALGSKISSSIAGILAISISYTAMVISILALTFTIFSFWWMNWRKSKIIVGDPRSFTLATQGLDELLIVQLPLVFYNSGAATQVVQNLRLTLEQNNKKSSKLNFNNTVSDLSSNDGRTWGRQFPIEGRKTYSNIFVFQKKPGKFIPTPGKCKAILEWKSYDDMTWKQLHTFNLLINKNITEKMGRLIPYDNDLSA
ncbi:MAG: hypothetical protein PHX71_09940 [Synergistales bacterium]|nr:hypothetical protein [Synergistales bacterium]